MDSALVTALTNFGAAGIVVILIILGYLIPKPFYTRLEEENRQLREALDAERQRGNAADQAGRVTNQLITALSDLATERHRSRRPPGAGPPDAGLSWEDIS